MREPTDDEAQAIGCGFLGALAIGVLVLISALGVPSPSFAVIVAVLLVMACLGIYGGR